MLTGLRMDVGLGVSFANRPASTVVRWRCTMTGDIERASLFEHTDDEDDDEAEGDFDAADDDELDDDEDDESVDNSRVYCFGFV